MLARSFPRDICATENERAPEGALQRPLHADRGMRLAGRQVVLWRF